MKQDYVCVECGHQYDELGDGKCYVCGGNVILVEEVGQEEQKYPEDLVDEEDEQTIKPQEFGEDLDEDEEQKLEEA